ncbi:SAM-dependent methyltransferase [Roseovarius sp. AK1035]|nr:SAM-dependent methyltransferase [Roseovarius sp. AK1035]
MHCNIPTDQELVELTETFPELGIKLSLHKMVETFRPMNEFHFCLKVV